MFLHRREREKEEERRGRERREKEREKEREERRGERETVPCSRLYSVDQSEGMSAVRAQHGHLPALRDLQAKRTWCAVSL